MPNHLPRGIDVTARWLKALTEVKDRQSKEMMSDPPQLTHSAGLWLRHKHVYLSITRR